MKITRRRGPLARFREGRPGHAAELLGRPGRDGRRHRRAGARPARTGVTPTPRSWPRRSMTCSHPLLIGKDPRNIRERLARDARHARRLPGWEGLTSARRSAPSRSRSGTSSGKDAGVSVAQLLGGGPDRIRLFGTGTTMFEMSADWHAHYFDPALAAGSPRSRSASGKNPAADLELIRTVRDHIGPDGLLMVDAYWGYSPDQALELAREHGAVRHLLLRGAEPAVHAGRDRLALARIRRSAIAVGERVYSPTQFADIARRGSASVFQPDAQICGGILACLEIATLGPDRRHRGRRRTSVGRRRSASPPTSTGRRRPASRSWSTTSMSTSRS